ncbi:Fur family transcriptional regulator [Rhizobium sp. FKL33]|uniref:Fur family transcriptional regulator n=1 Tax=Rhizobium sp. FKL33 TaxID=2562307 RepID=UPI0010C1292B|nr:Fur family transcriptional regulator [Rhizobium sp. FKL33]
MKAEQNLTKNQALVLGALNGAAAPLSAYDILDRLRGDGFRAPLQVYRALEKLVEQRLVHRLESLNAFVACAHPHDHHDHHHGVIAFAICDTCGQVTEFHDHTIEGQLKQWQAATQFKAEKTTIEIRGACKNCA